MKKYLIPLLLVLILGMNFFFLNYYFPGSTLDGADVSWQKRTLEATAASEKSFTLTAPSLGKTFHLLEGGLTHHFSRPGKDFFSLKAVHLLTQETLRYDEDRLREEIHGVLEEIPAHRPAKDAQLLLKDGELTLIPHELGLNLPDEEGLMAMIQESLAKKQVELDLEPFILSPQVRSADLRPKMKLWQSYSLRNEDYSWVLEGKDLLSLYKEDFSVDEKKATALFESYFKEADGGNMMWVVDGSQSLQPFLEALKTHAPTWEATYKRVRKDPDPGYAMTNGIAVSVDRQWLWFYQNGDVVFQAPVITGNPNRGYPTHRGYWSILDMATDTRLANTNREGYAYDVPVNYWMHINNEGMIEGIHDATWHWAFGTDVYLWDGSHGCINLSVGDMATLYSMSWVGLPVWVY